MPKPTTLTIAIPNFNYIYKIKNVTVNKNLKLENEEDFAEDIAKATVEAYGFSSYFSQYDWYILFFNFFDSNLFGSDYFYGLVHISSLFFLLSLVLFPIVQERNEAIK